MAEANDPNIGGILLAAGGSSRLGRPKQLLEFNGKTLIRRAAETLVDSKCDLIVVVLGAEIERSSAELDGLDVAICINENWHSGMSSSIIAGLNSLLETEPTLDAVVITLCDQPHVTSDDINDLIVTYINTESPIVASQYGPTIGVPALFSSEMFTELFQLGGDKGARQLIRENIELAKTVLVEKAAIDIDTLEDLGNLAH
ncbi:MAG: nucleotidyltransferase family protein [Blastocatellia bacterium]|nr:nucleotidyltransferase family protein [Blastocatellia bacterium]